MAKKNNHLTGSEEELMELFWNSEEALTSVDILRNAADHSWSDSYIHIMLRALLKKGMIRICGAVQYGTQYARQFVPLMTKEEYAARLVMSKVETRSIARVTAAMVSEAGGKIPEDLFKQLEGVVNGIIEEGDKKS